MIPLKTRGKSNQIETTLVVRVTRNKFDLGADTFYLHEDFEILPDFEIQTGMLSLFRMKKDDIIPVRGVYNIFDLSHLQDGDIVSVSPNGLIITLFRISSNNNSLFVTERCNSNCLMCSQPPKNKDDIEELYDINSRLISLIPKNTLELGITGGEPTLMQDLFPKLLHKIKIELPQTDIHVLTNGRTFSHSNIVKQVAAVSNNKVVFGVPLYSDYYQSHDYIVQAENAFNQTIIGLYNLARFGLRIEIRIVLHKLTIPRLVKLSKYIYKNLPFVEHIAFMGLEYTGYTPFNIEKLWIDPYDYQKELKESVEFLDNSGMNVSIYNHQLCTIPEELWKFSQKSISAWKTDYLEECEGCLKKEECGGFFSSSIKKHSEYITPINF